jgi:hypothetical protein
LLEVDVVLIYLGKFLRWIRVWEKAEVKAMAYEERLLGFWVMIGGFWESLKRLMVYRWEGSAWSGKGFC